MGEPDFNALRTEVEAATRLPEFDSVARRARRVRRRIFSRRLIVSLVTLGVVLPGGVGAVYLTPSQSTVQGDGDTQIGLEPPDDAVPTPSPSTAPVATIRAIAGARLASLYAAIDVCRPGDGTTRCSLQIVPLGTTAQDQREPIATDELRADPADSLTDVTLQALTPTSLLLSGIRTDGERKSRRINVNGGGAEIAPEPLDATEPDTGDLVVQLRRYGELSFVRQIDSRVFRLQNQPPIKEPTLVASISPARGWWVTGVDPVSGDVAVAVSRDLGQSWQVQPLGLRPGMGDPVLTTGDGRTVFVFLRSSAGIQQRRSTNGGLTWETLTTPMPWPSMGSTDVVSRRLGAVVRSDGSLLIWVEDAPGAVFLDSSDAGLSYRPASGPSGPIVAVQDGFVAQSDPPSVSRDGHTWSALPRPAILLPS
jgi:hypothetical protein